MTIGIITKYQDDFRYAFHRYIGNDTLIWIRSERSIIDHKPDACIQYFIEPDDNDVILGQCLVRRIGLLTDVVPEPEYNLPRLEQQVLKKALRKTKGDVTWSAEIMGISTRSVYRMLADYNIKVNEYRS